MLDVLVLVDCAQTGIKRGERYKAKRRPHSSKLELVERVPDGHDPECLEYIYNVAVAIHGQWHKIVDNVFVLMEQAEVDEVYAAAS